MDKEFNIIASEVLKKKMGELISAEILLKYILWLIKYIKLYNRGAKYTFKKIYQFLIITTIVIKAVNKDTELCIINAVAD